MHQCIITITGMEFFRLVLQCGIPTTITCVLCSFIKDKRLLERKPMLPMNEHLNLDNPKKYI